MKGIIEKLKNSHGALRVPWLTIVLASLMIALYSLGSTVFDLFLFDKALILKGEYWRIFTGHFVHCNMEHLFWDLLAFVVIGSVIEINKPQHLLASFVSSCAFVSAWLFIGEIALTTYCGLSGALNGMLVLAAIMQWNKNHEKKYLMVLGLTLLKITFEFLNHETVFTSLASQAVPGSHAAGYVGGVIYLIYFHLIKHFNNTKLNKSSFPI